MCSYDYLLTTKKKILDLFTYTFRLKLYNAKRTKQLSRL